MTQVTRSAPPGGLEEYNPFTDTRTVSHTTFTMLTCVTVLERDSVLLIALTLTWLCFQAAPGNAAKPAPAPAQQNTQPAIMKPTEEPPSYSQQQTQVCTNTETSSSISDHMCYSSSRHCWLITCFLSLVTLYCHTDPLSFGFLFIFSVVFHILTCPLMS